MSDTLRDEIARVVEHLWGSNRVLLWVDIADALMPIIERERAKALEKAAQAILQRNVHGLNPWNQGPEACAAAIRALIPKEPK